MKEPKWPTHPDGKPKKMGELSKEEQRKQFRAVINKLKPEFAKQGIKLVLPTDLN